MVVRGGQDLGAPVAHSIRQADHLLVVQRGQATPELVQPVRGAAGAGGCLELARMLVRGGARVLLTGRCGPNAVGVLALAGIEVRADAQGTAAEAVHGLASGRPPRGERRGRGRGRGPAGRARQQNRGRHSKRRR